MTAQATQADKAQNMSLAPGVVDTIIAITANETEGVVQTGTPAGGFFARLIKKPSTSGIDAKLGPDGKIEVTLHITAKYGVSLTELAQKLREAIAEALMLQVGMEVAFVDIYVDGISFDRA